MINKMIRKSIIIVCMLITVCHPTFAFAKQQVSNAEDVDTETFADNEEAVVELEDEQVPLGLGSKSLFERYKRDVLIMVFFGSLVVVTTVGATVKEKYEKEKLN